MRKKYYARIFLIAGFIIVFLNVPPLVMNFAPTRHRLDPSWAWALGYALSHRLQWGKDIIFTYGPIGFLTRPYFYCNHYLWAYSAVFSLLNAVILPFVYIFVLYIISGKNKTWPNLAFYLFAFMAWVFLLPPQSFTWQYIFMSFLLVILVLDYPENNYLFLFFSAILLGVASSIKNTSLIASAALALLYPVLLIYLGKKEKLFIKSIFFLITFLSTFSIIYVAAGQSLLNLPEYFYSVYQIIGGYTDAMSLHGYFYGFLSTLGAASVIIMYFILTVGMLKGKQKLLFSRFLLLGTMLFLLWKEGFVRHDNPHIAIFFSYALVISTVMLSLIVRVGDYAGKKKYYKYLPVSIIIISLCFLLSGGGISILKINQYDNFRKFIILISNKNARKKLEMEQNKNIRNEYGLPYGFYRHIDKKTVNIIPWDLIIAGGYGFNLVMDPVIQAYSAYTPYLDKVNAGQIKSGSGPGRILYSYKSIDNRYPAFDEPAAFRALIYRYKTRARYDNYTLLIRNKKRCAIPGMLKIKAETAGFDEWIGIPENKKVDFAAITVDKNFFYAIFNFFYKPPETFIWFRLENGKIEGPYRFIYNVAGDGLYVRYFLKDQGDFTALFGHKNLNNSLTRIEAIKISAGRELESFVYNNKLFISFYASGDAHD